MKAPSRPLIIALVAVAVIAAAAFGVVTLRPDVADSIVSGLSGGTQEVDAQVDASATVEPAPKAEATTAASAPGASKGTTKPGNGPGTAGGSGSKDSGGSASSMNVRILWWNDTTSKKADGFEIVFGSKSVKPDTSKSSGTASLGPIPVGKEAVLVVYPDGRDGKRFEIPITLTADMEPDSDIDGIHVEVSDTSVRVLGNAVDNFDRSFPRF